MATISEGTEGAVDPQGILNTVSSLTTNVTTMTKQRVKLNMKVLGMQIGQESPSSIGSPSQTQVDKQTFREDFSPPQMSIVSKLMTKVINNAMLNLYL